jgi:hypothetical protein
MPSAELKTCLLLKQQICGLRLSSFEVPGILFFKIGKLHAACACVVGVCIIHYYHYSAPEKPLSAASLRFYGCNLTNDGGFLSDPSRDLFQFDNTAMSLSRLSAFSLVSSTGGQSPPARLGM